MGITKAAVFPEPVGWMSTNCDHKKKERTRFSYTDYVTILQANWDGLPLNGRRFLVTNLLNAI